ncbi:hypothetical protein SNEBB_008276 [Seison nebaliae]|nr:hypothetical protein SNEBB_008276 [Seison nebaliae]
MRPKNCNLELNLYNFDAPENVNSQYILTSPRSLEACWRLRIKPVELLPKTNEEIKKCIPGIKHRSLYQIHSEYETNRQKKVRACREMRQEIISQEGRYSHRSTPASNTHLIENDNRYSSTYYPSKFDNQKNYLSETSSSINRKHSRATSATVPKKPSTFGGGRYEVTKPPIFSTPATSINKPRRRIRFANDVEREPVRSSSAYSSEYRENLRRKLRRKDVIDQEIKERLIAEEKGHIFSQLRDITSPYSYLSEGRQISENERLEILRNLVHTTDVGTLKKLIRFYQSTIDNNSYPKKYGSDILNEQEKVEKNLLDTLLQFSYNPKNLKMLLNSYSRQKINGMVKDNQVRNECAYNNWKYSLMDHDQRIHRRAEFDREINQAERRNTVRKNREKFEYLRNMNYKKIQRENEYKQRQLERKIQQDDVRASNVKLSQTLLANQLRRFSQSAKDIKSLNFGSDIVRNDNLSKTYDRLEKKGSRYDPYQYHQHNTLTQSYPANIRAHSSKSPINKVRYCPVYDRNFSSNEYIHKSKHSTYEQAPNLLLAK